MLAATVASWLILYPNSSELDFLEHLWRLLLMPLLSQWCDPLPFGWWVLNGHSSQLPSGTADAVGDRGSMGMVAGLMCLKICLVISQCRIHEWYIYLHVVYFFIVNVSFKSMSYISSLFWVFKFLIFCPDFGTQRKITSSTARKKASSTGSQVGAAMDCGRPIDKAPVIFPSKLLQDVASKEHMFSGHLEKSPSDDWKKTCREWFGMSP